MPSQLHVYKSSAGSGKTTRLAIEYIKLALAYPEAYKHIIALTFTNKAAQEMKERILHFLSEIVAMRPSLTPPFFVEDILKVHLRYRKLLEIDKSKALQLLHADASLLFKRILHHYSDFAVSTLDSFTNRIIRSFSHDLGISFNYKVELDTNELLSLSVDELINRVHKDEKVLNTILTTFSRNKIDNERSRHISEDLQVRAKSLLNDVEEPFLKHLLSQDIEVLFSIYPKLKENVASIEKKISAFGKAFLDLCKQNDIQDFMFYQGKKSIYPYFRRIAQGDFDKLVPNTYVIQMITEGKWVTKKEYRDQIEAVVPDILNIYKAMQHFLETHQSDYILTREILKHFFPYLVLVDLQKELDRIKTENELLHISDFNKIIASKIANESSPYIFERIGNRYNHFLLDEFQDTSSIQWSNLIPLLENTLSENHFNLIVGDAKQSIYRWRGGDVQQFVQLPILPTQENTLLQQAKEQLFRHAYQEHILDTNYRSASLIVNFNNSFFTYILNHISLPTIVQEVYAEVQQKTPDKNKDFVHAFVELRAIDSTKLRKKEEVVDKYAQASILAVQDAIKHNYNYKDIAVLCRNNSDIVDMSVLCMAHNIPFVSSESLLVDSLDAVSFVFSFINFLQFDTAILYQVELVNYLDKHNYFSKEGSLTKILQTIEAQTALQSIWQQLNIEVDKDFFLSLDAYEGVEAIARLFRLPVEHPFFHFFLEAALKFSREHHQGLIAFVPWWEQHRKDFVVELPDEKNALRLMTIHKAKGLEFPVVISWFSDRLSSKTSLDSQQWLAPELEDFPEINSFPFKLSVLENTRLSSAIEHEKQMLVLDNLNLLYVALTRPTHSLYVLYDVPGTRKSGSEQDVYSLNYAGLFSAYVGMHSPKGRGDDRLLIGEKGQVAQSSSVLQDNYVYMLHNKPTADWQSCINLQIEEEKMWQLSMPIQHGIKVHRLLSQIHREGDVDKALNRMYFAALIDKEEVEHLRENIMQIIEHPQLKYYYSSEIYAFNELEICQEGGAIFRPDRLVISPNDCVVIEYKTGIKRTEHEEQLYHYMQLAAEFTHKPAKGFLVYINNTIDVQALRAL